MVFVCEEGAQEGVRRVWARGRADGGGRLCAAALVLAVGVAEFKV